MNIFEQYLDNIKSTLKDLSKKGEIILPDSLDGINAEIPPAKFNSDISTNVAMVLSKLNKKNPADFAKTLAELLKTLFSHITLGNKRERRKKRKERILLFSNSLPFSL